MLDTAEPGSAQWAGRQPSRRRAKWLLLIHHLPPKPDYLRVKVRRRLASFGAVLVKPSVYALPFSDECIEDFEWLRREITGLGGEAIVCATEVLSGLTDESLTALFVMERQQAYHELESQANELLVSSIEDPAAWRPAATSALNRMRRQLSEARAVDYFGAPGRATAEHAILALERKIFPEISQMQPKASGSPHGKVWVTRRGVKVDRMASAWLIRRFVDPDAEFAFVDPVTYTHAAGHVRFDMFEGEFTHELDLCTFEKILVDFSLDDPALKAISEIVHDIDFKEVTFDRPERAGISSLIDGIAAGHSSDEARLGAAQGLFDALYISLGGQRL